MRVVLDTNVLVSGLLWEGPPGRLVDQVLARKLVLLLSETLFDELEDVLTRQKFVAQLQKIGETPQTLFDLVRRRSQMIPVGHVESIVAADPDDDAVLACAVAGNADVIVSGDRHLLAMGSYRGIPILTVTALLERLEE